MNDAISRTTLSYASLDRFDRSSFVAASSSMEARCVGRMEEDEDEGMPMMRRCRFRMEARPVECLIMICLVL